MTIGHVIPLTGKAEMVNPIFAGFARHWGFTPKGCWPHRPQTKGKDERGVGYVKRSGIAGHRFDTWGQMESHLDCWNREIADVRIHGTTGEQPLVRFQRDEARALLDGVDFRDGPYDAVKDADVVVIVTEWDPFRPLDLDRLDPIGRLEPQHLSVEPQLCLDRTHDVLGATEPVTLALELDVPHGQPLGPHPLDDHRGMRGRHHRVNRTL